MKKNLTSITKIPLRFWFTPPLDMPYDSPSKRSEIWT